MVPWSATIKNPWCWWLPGRMKPQEENVSSTLGTVWHAEAAVQAWCQGELRSLDFPGKNESLRLVLCNPSDEDLVYSWITPHGELRGFRRISAQSHGTKNQNRSLWVEEEEAHDGCDYEKKKQHVERTFVGHAFVFGRLRNPDVPLDTLKQLEDVIVLGAYRSSRAFLPKQRTTTTKTGTTTDEKEEEEDNREFPCHVLTLKPPPPPASGGFLCCPTQSPYLRGNNRNNYDSRSKEKKSETEEPKRNPLLYDTDRSWTLAVRELLISQDKLLDTTATCFYSETTLCGWPVYVQDGCFDDGVNGEKMKQIFCRDFQYALDHLPEEAREKLKQVPCCIWINKCGLEYGPVQAPETLRNLCFHPGLSWLQDHRMHPGKVKCVEVYDLHDYCHNDRSFWGTGGVFIHELSHAYHHTCLPDGYDNADILQCYERAMGEGLYDCVKVHGPQGPTAKAYACQDAMEYFAELSTAFLGGLDQSQEYNKWYPFNRAQLQRHDPRAYDMLCKVWNINGTSA